MKIVSKYLEFKNTIEEVEGIGKAVFSRDSNNLIWHEVATKINNLLNIRTSVFVMILNNEIVQIEKDPSLISPLENSSVVEIDEENNLSVGKYVAISNDTLTNIDEPTGFISPVFDSDNLKWVESMSDSEVYFYNLKKEYMDYQEIDTPSIIREMELLDSSLVDEYVLMMIELRELISKYNMGISTISDIPTPSKALVDFKNRIKNIL